MSDLDTEIVFDTGTRRQGKKLQTIDRGTVLPDQLYIDWVPLYTVPRVNQLALDSGSTVLIGSAIACTMQYLALHSIGYAITLGVVLLMLYSLTYSIAAATGHQLAGSFYRLFFLGIGVALWAF